jgi:chromosome segregation ATPase
LKNKNKESEDKINKVNKLIEGKDNEIKNLKQNEYNNNNKLEKMKEELLKDNKLLNQENNSLKNEVVNLNQIIEQLQNEINEINKKNKDYFIFLNHSIFQNLYHTINSKILNNNIYSMEQKHGITNINMLYPFKSRTLDFEDVILFYIFPDIINGFYIDFN